VGTWQRWGGKGGKRAEGREREREKREAERGGGQPDEGGGDCTVRNRQLQSCVPAADDRGGENFSFRRS